MYPAFDRLVNVAKILLAVLAIAPGARAQESPHGAITIDCTSCHTTESWAMRADAKFDHKGVGFDLTGQHKIVKCVSCHRDLQFARSSAACGSCHTDVHRSELGQNCVKCHATDSWKLTDMVQKHQATRFPLVGVHATIPCQSCHPSASSYQYAGTPTTCIGCHRQDFQSTTNPNHAAAGFSPDCSRCHALTALAWKGSFDHNATAFPLSGAHRAVLCSGCHADRVFAGRSTACISCHQAEFNSTLNPNHPASGFPAACQACHSTNSWMGAAFDHNATRFPLTGAHTRALCVSCHADNVFVGKSTNCAACHQADFNTTANPNHVAAALPSACQSCHSTTTWLGATYDHNATRFPLTGAHVSGTCNACHGDNVFAGRSVECVSCHTVDFQGAANPPHVANAFSQQCTTCHTTIVWSPATFDHNATKFPLTGAHAALVCSQCHTSGNYQLSYIGCYSCHATDFNGAASPPHASNAFSQQCTTCHTTTVWSPSTFDHTATKFALTGAHVALACSQCHTNGNYQLSYTGCYSCHAADFNGAASPPHASNAFSQQCTTCHTTTVWSPSTFDHTATKFALTGAHVALACSQCHTSGNYQLSYTGCYSCHGADFNGAASPPHASNAFSQQCTTCHTTTVWSPSTFDHTATKFALTGAHVPLACNQCHANGNYQLSYTGCYSCHGADFTGAANPPHVSNGFSQQCTTCHTTIVWSPSTFDHSTTKFALTGAHLALACNQCHTNGNYQLSYAGCYSCHTADFNGTTNPPHASNAFSQQCTTCHTTTAWSPATFDHSASRFPLTGAHVPLACIQCHTNGNYQISYTGCYACHATDYAGAANPPHASNAFSQQCTTCHTTIVWSPSTFDHGTTKFALTGAHVPLACSQCHTNGNYQLAYAGCYSCHAPDYAGAASPPHASNAFSQQCTTCHTTTGWSPSTFDHGATKFALTGAHLALACNQCHTNGNYQISYTNCYSCHTADFNGTTNPPHVANAFSQDCTTCHTTAAWNPATFDHSTTKFPLTGAHVPLPCIQCHTNGNYQISYAGCYSCHTADYAGTTNPNHTAAGFPTTCQTCHTTTSWAGATFNHTWFPTNHGNAGGVCATCHTNPTDFSVFQCTNCHTQAQTDPHHTDVRNYVYNSTNCYQCHPSGNGG